MRRPSTTSKDRRALILCPEPPYPIRGGGALRTASLIEYLNRDHSVELAIFRESGLAFDRPEFAAGIMEIEIPRHSRHFLHRAARNLGRLIRDAAPLVDRFSGFEDALAAQLDGRTYDVAVLEHLWTAPYLPLVRRHARCVILNLHNVESELMRQIARPFAGAAARAEARWLPQFDRILVASEEDRRRTGGDSVVYPNAIPDRPMPPRAERLSIAMSGNFEYAPNRQGRKWFEDRVLPSLKVEFPALEWELIGRGARPVDDAVTELARSQVAVAPILSGSGTRLKILEAWAAGTPVVSTTLGAEGLGAEAGRHLLIADQPAEFGEAVCALLRDPGLRDNIRNSAHKLLEERFTWTKAWNRLDQEGGLY